MDETKNSIHEQDTRPLFLKDAIYQGEMHAAPYALSVSGPKIEAIDKGKIVALAHQTMQQQADQQINMLKKQAALLIQQAREIEERLQLSHQIYQSEMGFEPVIGSTYHLYQRPQGNWVLSMIAPYEWGKQTPFTFLNTVRLLGDRTWEVLA